MCRVVHRGDVFNDVTVLVPNASLLCLTLSLSHTHFAFMHITHMQAHLTFLHALPTLHSLTYGDVEAINAEGGTPTLPESMLLGVSFHRFANLQ